MVYFVQGVEGGNIKIGTTIRLSARVPQLEYQYKLKLRILGVTKGGMSEEQAIHRRFAHLNAEDEWFFPEEELTLFVREETTAWDGKDEARSVGIAKIDSLVLRDARIVCSITGEDMQDFLTRLLEPLVSKAKVEAFEKERVAREKTAKPKKGSKGD